MHSAVGGFFVKRENKVAGKKINYIMLGIAPEKLRKYHSHNAKLQKGRENAPQHTQNGTLVFFLEISFDQLREKELIFFNFIYLFGKLLHNRDLTAKALFRRIQLLRAVNGAAQAVPQR